MSEVEMPEVSPQSPAPQKEIVPEKKKKKDRKPRKEKSSLRFFSTAVLTTTIFIFVLLLICQFSLVSGFIPFLEHSSGSNAALLMEQNLQIVESQITTQFDNLSILADDLAGSESREDVVSYLETYIGSEQFGDLQFISSGEVFTERGLPIAEGPAFGMDTGSQKAISKVEYYPLGATRCVALYLPVKGSAAVDGLISIIPASQLLDLTPVSQFPVEITAVVTTKGETLAETAPEDFPFNIGQDFLVFFKEYTQSKDTANMLGKMLSTPSLQIRRFHVNALDYTVSTSPLTSSNGELALLTVCPNSALASEQRSYIQLAIIISVLTVFALFCASVYVIISRKRAPRIEETSASEAVPASGAHINTRVKSVEAAVSAAVPHCCTTPEQFISQCNQLIKNGRQKRHMFCAEIKEFPALVKRIGEASANDALYHLEKVLSSMCSDGEIFCYGGAGAFYAYLRCSEAEDIRKRSQLLLDLAHQCKLPQGEQVEMRIGVYSLSSQPLSVRVMMQNAALAKNMVMGKMADPYLLYSQNLAADHQNNARIEQQMEDALATGEFKLFLQPKYSVALDQIDSAEALVRWFDPRRNDYIFPGKFIPLFESNGFITKLDHFMYLEVLKYFEDAAEHGTKVCPICVNVSRVTALQPDFLNFYVSKKKQHNIKDNYLTLEFAESFVAQNFALMKDLFQKLNENGIRCSIDNFASGSGSLGILKKLPINEINIDRSFLFNGLDHQRDVDLQKNLVTIAKSFGVRVVQSGVENKELFDQCCSAGCDLIQGYYFARAISLEEYRIFINTNTSIRYKAVVK